MFSFPKLKADYLKSLDGEQSTFRMLNSMLHAIVGSSFLFKASIIPCHLSRFNKSSLKGISIKEN